MTELFTNVLNMSITASYVAFAVIIIRILLKKAPKIYSYALWFAVLFRLICPFSFSSMFSFFSILDLENNYIPQNISVMEQPSVNAGLVDIDNVTNNSLPTVNTLESANQIIIESATIIWLIIMGLMIAYSMVSYIRIRYRLQHATLVKDNIFETDRISTPCVLGFIHPRIYIPTYIAPDEILYVLKHEQTHMKRFDYLIKPFAFCVLIFHWFNPLMWICYSLMSKDMEMSCDESVMKHMDRDIRGSYSNSLLSLSTKQSGIFNQSGLASPLAFSEGNVKSRIKNILNYKRPTFWVSGVTCIAIIILAISLISNTVKHEVPPIYILMEDGQSAEAMLGTYSWDFGNEQVEACSINPTEFLYTLDNTITVQKGQQLIISNQKLNKDRQSPFTLLDISYWEDNQGESILDPDSFAFHNGDLYINAPEAAGEYIYNIHLKYDRGNVYYGFKMIVKSDAPFKGLELYVWKNKEMTGNSDTYYTLLLGTNRNKDENEIYDLEIAVNSVDKLNELLNGYSLESELFIYQMNETDFTKDEMLTISDSINFPKGNGVKTIGLWQSTAIPEVTDATDANQISRIVTENLETIMSSPTTQSDPQDYIEAHQNEYETIVKYGEEALNYLLSQFETGDNDNLRGHIMMRLCKELLGDRNNVMDETLSPQEWFNKLSIREEIKLKNFSYSGIDPIEKLVYGETIIKYSQDNDGFIVLAPTIHGSYEEGDKLKIFATVFSNRYKLYDKILSEVGGSIIPVAITFTKNENESYTLSEYLESLDGAYWESSIQEFCTMPVSGKEIVGLAQKIVDDYGSNEERSELLIKNLKEHLKASDQEAIILNGQIIN